jgi:DNA-binding PadR family transcriptional regulator
LADGEGHAYGITNKIVSMTIFGFSPARNAVRVVLLALERDGLARVIFETEGHRSPNNRRIYALTERGWTLLRLERRRLNFAAQAIDRAFVNNQLRKL